MADSLGQEHENEAGQELYPCLARLVLMLSFRDVGIKEFCQELYPLLILCIHTHYFSDACRR